VQLKQGCLKSDRTFHNVFHRVWDRGFHREGIPRKAQNRQKQRFFEALPESYLIETQITFSDRSRASQDPQREHEDRTEKTEDSVNGDAHKAKWQRQQPHERIQHQSK
jgi:hypothetical protein